MALIVTNQSHRDLPPMGRSSSLPSRTLRLALYAMTLTGAVAQVAGTPQANQTITSAGAKLQSSQLRGTIEAYQQEQNVLIQEKRALVAEAASAQQFQSWNESNAVQLAAQKQRGEAVANLSALAPVPIGRPIVISSGASSALKALLTTQAALGKAQAQIHNKLVQQYSSSGQSLTSAQVIQIQTLENQLFQEQEAPLLALRERQLAAVGKSFSSIGRPPMPAVVVVSGIAPQVASFLASRNLLIQERAQLQQEYATADPTVRDMALEKWQQQNSSSLSQLQQQSQSLSQAPVSPSN